MILLRVLGALVSTQVLSGIIAYLLAPLMLGPNSGREFGLFFATLAGFVVIPIVLVVEFALVFVQSRLSIPSLALQVLGSAIAGLGLVVLINYAFWSGNSEPSPKTFFLVHGFVSGAAIGAAWFYLIVIPGIRSS